MGSNYNNKKVGILTLYYKNYNCGGLLQAYALQKVIAELGYDCQQISFNRKSKEVLFRRIRGIFRDPKELIKILKKRGFSKIRQKALAGKSVELFNKFMDSIPHSEVVDSQTISTLNNKFDIFIVGSDQVWNTEFVPYSFFLDFVDKSKKKISYAASIRVNQYEKREGKKIKELVNDFDYISVREKKAITILESIGVNKQVDLNIDPVLLLTKEQWDYVAIKPNIKEKYIVTYLISDNYRLTQIGCFADANNCKLININDETKDTIGPAEFLGLIKFAEFVFVDSFHGVAFSILYGKRFLAFGNFKEDDRKKTILELTGLSDRCIDNKTRYSNYSLTFDGMENAQQIIHKLRTDSLDRLCYYLNN